MAEVVKYSYICDGVQNVFEYLFETFDTSYIKIYVNNKLVEKDFKIYPFVDKSGGKVVFNVPPLEGEILTILRELDFSRVCDFQTGGVLRAEDLNYELNYNIACLNQLNNYLKNSLKVSNLSGNNVNSVLPPAKAGCTIVWNENCDGFKNLEVDLEEKVNYIEDCLNSVECIYNDLTDIITNSLDVGILGLFNNLLNILKKYHPEAFIDLKSISSVSDDNVDCGVIADSQTVNLKDYGRL